MREYELTAVYDLAVAEQGGPDAAVKLLTAVVEARGGKMAKVDHWGRRRLAYPIGRAIDGDYIISRVELEPTAVSPLEEMLRIDERVYRHLVVRADELPAPPQPREPRRLPGTAPQPEAAAEPVERDHDQGRTQQTDGLVKRSSFLTRGHGQEPLQNCLPDAAPARGLWPVIVAIAIQNPHNIVCAPARDHVARK